MDSLRTRIGRAAADAVIASVRIGQQATKPLLVLGNQVVQRFPKELVPLGSEQNNAQGRVVYDFFAGIGPELAHPGGDLPGANRWDEPLDPEHPIPVILVHGTAGGGQTNWGTYVPLLTEAGYSVFSLTYGAIDGARWPISALGGMKPIEESAAEFGDFAEKVMAATGADKVHVVGHSQGTLVPNYWAKYLGGADKIAKYVSLAPLWEGTSLIDRASLVFTGANKRLGLDPATVIPCRALPQMMDGSSFIQKMNADGGPYLPGIEYTNISTVHDELVRPFTSGQVPGRDGTAVHNIVLQNGCVKDLSDHLGICGSPRAAAFVLNALDDQPTHVVPCQVVAPFFGTPLLRRTGGVPELIKPFAAPPGRETKAAASVRQ
ncbi:lipase family protein [Gordonia sp. HY002]|uniref:esterase/lipase family protein n=1 Tax=Gordonia zhenghanii TaxID=2911516 RepID=UPI001EF0A344|nr:alpha/beta fold hydrolase [Gordonia zhenghanii]MCF8570840.1 lipase family protein [Gordonia zhenghanii]MCF8605296.1 lipase family protein [Gordonia zhenghanii]